MRFLLAGFITILIAQPTECQLSPQEASQLYKSFDFVMLSSKPGAAIAFRLKKKYVSESLSVCYRQECLNAKREWQLLATDPGVAQKQILVLQDQLNRYAFRRIALDSDLPDQAHPQNQKIATPLRLPANVVTTLEEEAPQITIDQFRDKSIFSQNTKTPWSNQWVVPVNSHVTSEFGSWRRAPNGEPYGHTGTDIHAAQGTKVRATSDGVVVQAEVHVIEGRVVTIDHGGGLMSRYAHLSEFKVKPGDLVKTGDVVGLSGSTGRSEAPHLHFEMRIRGRPVDPLSTQHLMARLSYLE